jgi:peptide/nickel transport system substrate-binding protein
MRHIRRHVSGVAAVAAVAMVFAACGSSKATTGSGGSGTASSGTSASGTSATGSSGTSASTSGTASSSGYAPGGTLKVLMGTAPDSLDPDYGYTAQSLEADYNVYTPLYTYAHKAGAAGAVIIPGLATALPVVTDNGKTYTMTLRSGLKFSTGKPVVASDFTFAIERSIKINWGGDSFFTANIVGAAAFQKGTAKTISGIKTDNATGKIVISLTAAYGAFENVLSFVSAAPIPPTTPMKPESASPPPGVGPYMITAVKPQVSFTMAKDPSFKALNIPGIPDGYVNNIDVTVQSNTNTETQEVLDNQADEFDWSDTVSPALLQQVEAQKSRFKLEPVAGTDYFFMNEDQKPFNSPLAREALNLAISRTALSRLASGLLVPACYYLPPGIPGHVTGNCAWGGSAADTGSPADLAKAKALVKQSGMEGTAVTVWSQNRVPRVSFTTYLNSVLNQIGFKSTLKNVADTIYFQTIGSAKTNPQVGFADWFQDFPNPGDFYLVLDSRAIAAVNSENFGNVKDPTIQSTIIKLGKDPAADLAKAAPQWEALEKHVMTKEEMAPFGYLDEPFFLSDRVDSAKAIFQPVAGDDWTSFELKS